MAFDLDPLCLLQKMYLLRAYYILAYGVLLLASFVHDIVAIIMKKAIIRWFHAYAYIYMSFERMGEGIFFLHNTETIS